MDGFYEGFRDGQNALLANKQQKTADRQTDISEGYLDLNRNQTQFSQEFKMREEFRNNLKSVVSGLAELKTQATTPQRIQALEQQAQLVKEAFMVEAERLGLADQTDAIINRALSVPTVLEQAALQGQASATSINSQADMLSPDRQIAAGLAPKQKVPAISQSDLATVQPNVGADNSQPLRVSMVRDVADELVANGIDPVQAEELAAQKVNAQENADKEGTVFESIDEASGPTDYLKTISNKVPILNQLVFFEETQDAAQTIDLFNERVKKDLTGKANYSVKELEGIEPLLPKRGVTSTEEAAFIKYNNLRKKLLGDLREAQTMTQKDGLSKGAYSNARKRVEGLNRVLEQLGEPMEYVRSRIPQGAIDKLKNNPSLKSDFDEKFGSGMADIVLGDM